MTIVQIRFWKKERNSQKPESDFPASSFPGPEAARAPIPVSNFVLFKSRYRLPPIFRAGGGPASCGPLPPPSSISKLAPLLPVPQRTARCCRSRGSQGGSALSPAPGGSEGAGSAARRGWGEGRAGSAAPPPARGRGRGEVRQRRGAAASFGAGDRCPGEVAGRGEGGYGRRQLRKAGSRGGSREGRRAAGAARPRCPGRGAPCRRPERAAAPGPGERVRARRRGRGEGSRRRSGRGRRARGAAGRRAGPAAARPPRPLLFPGAAARRGGKGRERPGPVLEAGVKRTLGASGTAGVGEVPRGPAAGAALRALLSGFTPGGGASRRATITVPTDRRPRASGLLWAAFPACDNPDVFSLPGGSQKAVGAAFLNPSAWHAEPDVLHSCSGRVLKVLPLFVS